MGDAAVVLQLFDRPGDAPKNIDVGGLGGQHGGQRRVGGFAVEAGAADAGAGKKVGDRLHSSLESIVTGGARAVLAESAEFGQSQSFCCLAS